MNRSFGWTLALVGMLVCGTAPALGADAKSKEPGEKATDKVYEWKAKNGIAYQYFIPKGWKKDAGTTLTIVLHGSNLDRRWGFANHKAGVFRPSDVVVCPDGTTSNGRGGFNNLQSAKDVKLFRQLHEELIETFNVKGTYLYGHSQGSFFSFLYAGEAPDLVNGVVGHASGTWIGTQATKRHHHQAIVLMHGTADPVVPYGQSVGGYAAYRDAKYPLVRLRSLQGWNHWPAEHNLSIGNVEVPHTSQQLAWVEGMTTKDPARRKACFELLAEPKAKEWHDFAALYALAGHVARTDKADADLLTKAEAARVAVEALAALHVAEIEKSLPKDGGKTLGKGEWAVHLPMFLRDFAGVPACETLRGKWEPVLGKHQKDAIANLKKYYKKRQKDAPAALASAAAALKSGFLWFECQDWTLLNAIKELQKSASKKLKKGAKKDLDALVPAMEKALKSAQNTFMKLNRKF